MKFALEDSTTEEIPILLEQILKQIFDEKLTSEVAQKDFLFVLVVILLFENHFCLYDSEQDKPIPAQLITAKFLLGCKTLYGVYSTRFILSGFEDTVLQLVISPLGSAVLVNVLVNSDNLETYSVCLPVSRYVVSPQASTLPMIFRDLRHLSTTFKNTIINPVKSSILILHGYPSGSLNGLPEELFLKIMLLLPVSDIIKVKKLSKRFKYLIDNEVTWHELCKRDFSSKIEKDVSDWKEHYKKCYVETTNQRVRQSCSGAGTMHDSMEYSDLVSYIDNPMWADVI